MRAREEVVVAFRDIACRTHRVVGWRATVEDFASREKMVNELNDEVKYVGVRAGEGFEEVPVDVNSCWPFVACADLSMKRKVVGDLAEEMWDVSCDGHVVDGNGAHCLRMGMVI